MLNLLHYHCRNFKNAPLNGEGGPELSHQDLILLPLLNISQFLDTYIQSNFSAYVKKQLPMFLICS